MFTKASKGIFAATLGAASWLSGEVARGQTDSPAFQAPVNSVMFDDTGKLEGMQGSLIQFRDSKDAIWLLQVNQQTEVHIVGEAKFNYLRPGMLVELTGKIREDGAFEEPIAEFEVINPKGRPTLGLFEVGDKAPDAKPVREPVPGEYRVRARVVGVKADALNLVAGRLKLTGTPSDDAKVILAVDDPRLAQVGDEMRVKAWYYEVAKPTMQRPGQALAETVDITLANPPVATNKRGR